MGPGRDGFTSQICGGAACARRAPQTGSRAAGDPSPRGSCRVPGQELGEWGPCVRGVPACGGSLCAGVPARHPLLPLSRLVSPGSDRGRGAWGGRHLCTGLCAGCSSPPAEKSPVNHPPGGEISLGEIYELLSACKERGVKLPCAVLPSAGTDALEATSRGTKGLFLPGVST